MKLSDFDQKGTIQKKFLFSYIWTWGLGFQRPQVSEITSDV